MLFNSLDFIGFFACVWLAYFLFRSRLRAQNLLLLGASYFFYGYWDWRFLSLILANGPLYEGLMADAAFTRYLAGVNTFVAGIANEFDQVDAVLATPPRFAASDMENADHLVASAARRYTEQLWNHAGCPGP